jgi:hypothetical protein
MHTENTGGACACNGTGKVHVIAQIGTVINAGNDQIDGGDETGIKPNVHTIRSESIDGEMAVVNLSDRKAGADGDSVRTGAFFIAGRYYKYIVFCRKRLKKSLNAFGINAVVICE